MIKRQMKDRWYKCVEGSQYSLPVSKHDLIWLHMIYFIGYV